MSALYCSLTSERGESTKCGHKTLFSHIRGWTSGVRVRAFHTKEYDEFLIYITSGSNGSHPDVLIGVLKDGVFTPKLTDQ